MVLPATFEAYEVDRMELAISCPLVTSGEITPVDGCEVSCSRGPKAFEGGYAPEVVVICGRLVMDERHGRVLRFTDGTTVGSGNLPRKVYRELSE